MPFVLAATGYFQGVRQRGCPQRGVWRYVGGVLTTIQDGGMRRFDLPGQPESDG